MYLLITSALTLSFGVSIRPRLNMGFQPPLSSLRIYIATRSHHVVVCCSPVDCYQWHYCAWCIPVFLFCCRTALSLLLLPSCALLPLLLLGRDCDYCLPVIPLYPLCSCRLSSSYCYCCCCRCCVCATSFYLYRILCPILAAGVLLPCYIVSAEVLLCSPPFLPQEPPHLYYPVL